MYPSTLGNYHNDNTYYSKTPQENYYHPSPIYIPLEDEAVFSDFFQQQHFFSSDTSILAHEMINTNVESTMGECSNNNGQVDVNTSFEPENSSPRKRPTKGVRHSKINTARGPRDRRMRLSLDVARKLFGLQDLLGFDKASKTVDWLLTKSKTAILELLPDRSCSFVGVSNSASCSSECEVLSGTRAASDPPPMVIIPTGDDKETTKNKAKTFFESSKKQKEKVSRGVRRCADFHHPIAKATRERARERARERTTAKRNNKHLSTGQLNQATDQDVTQLGSWSPFEENKLERVGQVDRMSSNFHIQQGFVNENSSMSMMGNWNPSYVFHYQHTRGLTNEHQFNEYQITGKAWEGNNN